MEGRDKKGRFIKGYKWPSKNTKYKFPSGSNHPNWKGGKVKKKCFFCNKEFKVSYYRKNKAKFCSIKCADRGKRHPLYRGGKQKTGLGYIHILKPNHPFADKRGRVFEHRLVMEKYLGRYLKPEEVVHHKNKIVDDNRIENLKLFTSNGEHLSYEFSEKKMKKLEETSLDALYKHCPLCGQIGKNYYCKPCNFKWKKGYIYFSSVGDIDKWP